jgi:hypothetical protein
MARLQSRVPHRNRKRRHRRELGQIGTAQLRLTRRAGQTLRRNRLLRGAAKWWATTISALAISVLTSIANLLAGIQPMPTAVPVLKLLQRNPFLIATLASIALLVTVAAWMANRFNANGGGEMTQPATSPLTNRIWITVSSSFAAASTSALIVLMTLIIFQPAWCPQSLCRQPTGPHDSSLEVRFTSLQSEAFLLTADPITATIKDMPSPLLPTSVAAVRLATGLPRQAAPTGSVALLLHNLERSSPLIMEDVALKPLSAQSVRVPLRVIRVTSSVSYGHNLYQFTYNGELPGQLVSSLHTGIDALGHVQLQPGESDEIVVQVASKQLVELRFHIQIVYRKSNESTLHQFELPNDFLMVVSDQLNWQLYTFQGGRIVPG